MKKMFFTCLLFLALVAQSCSTVRFYQAYAPNTQVTVKDANDSTLLSVQVPKGKFGISTRYLTTDSCKITIGTQVIKLTH